MLTKKPAKFEKYIDPTGEFTNKELRLAEWYLRHKILLGKIGAGVLIVWCVVTIGYSIWGWGAYLIFGWSQDRRLISQQARELQNYRALQPLYAAKELEVESVQVFRSGAKKFDAVADVKNVNERWSVRLKYHFVFGSEATPIAETVLLPQTARPVAFFGYQSDSYPEGAQFIIDEISWRRLNPHAFPDVAGYQSERLQFAAETFVFRPPEAASGVAVPGIVFDLLNQSAYSYWRPAFYVDLFNGFQRVGILFLSTEQFRAGTRRAIDLRYFGDQLTVTEIRVHPVVDIYDDSVYMSPAIF